MIGPNGAGKTTLMRVISGLIRPTPGSITMEGVDLLATPAHRILESRHRACAGEPPPVPAHDGRGQSADGRLHPGRAREVRRAAGVRLRPVSADEGAPRAARRHDVRRRAADVRHRPRADVGSELLLLDEPSAGLAPVVVQQVFGLVERIRASGLTVLIVEQMSIRSCVSSIAPICWKPARSALPARRPNAAKRHDQGGVSWRIEGRCRHSSTCSTSTCWRP